MRKTLYVPGLAGLLTLVAAGPALAQQPRQQQDVTEQTFTDGDQVTGDRDNPYGDRIRAHIRLQRTSLVRPRTTFVRELLESVEDT